MTGIGPVAAELELQTWPQRNPDQNGPGGRPDYFSWRSLVIAPQALLENVFEKARRRRLFRLRTREDWAEVQGLGSPKKELSAPGASFKRLRDPSGSSPKMCVV